MAMSQAVNGVRDGNINFQKEWLKFSPRQKKCLKNAKIARIVLTARILLRCCDDRRSRTIETVHHWSETVGVQAVRDLIDTSSSPRLCVPYCPLEGQPDGEVQHAEVDDPLSDLQC